MEQSGRMSLRRAKPPIKGGLAPEEEEEEEEGGGSKITYIISTLTELNLGTSEVKVWHHYNLGD